MPAGHAPLVATVALPPAPSVACAPLTLSFRATFATGVDATPAVALPLSGAGAIEAPTVIVAVAVSHAAGLVGGFTHNVYAYWYVPGEVPAATVIVPSAFIAIDPTAGAGAVPGVSVLLPDVAALAPTVSLTKTDAVVPPAAALTDPSESSTASMIAVVAGVLLAPAPSFEALVVAVSVTLVGAVSLPPGVPGAV